MSVLAAIAVVLFIGYHYGAAVGGFALLAACLACYGGHGAMRASLKREGYVVDLRADGTGRKRWRIGLAAPVPAAAVQWVAPTGVRR